MANQQQIGNIDRIDDLEESFGEEQTAAGYDEGYKLGRKAGEDEGFQQGLIEGTRLGSEIGFYRGITMTWIQLLKDDSSAKSAKILKKLNEVHELTTTFPKTNETSCEEKLSNIQTKFKHSMSLLKLKV